MRLYKFLTFLLSPFVVIWLYKRRLQGKEDPLRFRERFGFASKSRPVGKLLWVHAASIGEANSVLLLISAIRARYPQLSLLLTTGTVTSAQLMQQRLPSGVLHQFAPVDTPQATSRFIAHWQPNIALWVESELWPNLVNSTRQCAQWMGIVNARMSHRSFSRWQHLPEFAGELMAAFDMLFAQSDEDAKRLQALGAKQLLSLGNLKYDAAELPVDNAAFAQLKEAIGSRPVWLAASTHPGEEIVVAQAHRLLVGSYPELLTIIAPRHPHRSAQIRSQLAADNVSCATRSQNELPVTAKAIYLADTLGELGLFYRMCPIVFMGGSLVHHGGQNPLEAARLGCALLTGTHTHNFKEIYQQLTEANALQRIHNVQELVNGVESLLQHPELCSAMQGRAQQWVTQQNGALERIMQYLEPILKAAAL